MYPADGDHALLAHQLAQHLLPGDQRYASLSCHKQFWMIWVQDKSRRNHYQLIDVHQVIRAMPNLYRHANVLQGARGSRGLHIAAANNHIISTSLQYHLRHCRDALTAYTHKMPSLFVQMLTTSCFCFWVFAAFVSAILTTSATMSCVASGLPKVRAASPIDCNNVLDVSIVFTRFSSNSRFNSLSLMTWAASLRPNMSAFASWGELPMAGGKGTRMLGLPRTASSHRVAATEPHK